MSDLISRQAVLKLLSTIPPEEAITKALLIQSVKQMDAPDNLVKDSQGLVKDLVNDCISRKAAIDVLHMDTSIIPFRKAREYADATIEEIRNRLEKLPSAQPEKRTEKRTETHACDCISREAAIDAVRTYYDDEYALADGIEELIEKLPSAQPEQQWIPCSERLPEHGGRYLISVLDGINRRTTVAPYLPRCKAWAMNGRMAYWKVIAWMPLPEPYREEEQDG